ncbi:MAG: hypothetical protein JSV06_12110, partial [Myxococcales bacterium]
MLDRLEQALGVAPWVLESVFAPLVAFALVFLCRELLLSIYRRRVDDPDRRKLWRRRTFWGAVPVAIVLAVGAAEFAQRWGIAAATDQSADVDTAIALTRGIAYTALAITLWVIVGRVARNLSARLDEWKPAEEGVKLQGAVLLSPVRVRGMLQAALRGVAILIRVLVIYL